MDLGTPCLRDPGFATTSSTKLSCTGAPLTGLHSVFGGKMMEVFGHPWALYNAYIGGIYFIYHIFDTLPRVPIFSLSSFSMFFPRILKQPLILGDDVKGDTPPFSSCFFLQLLVVGHCGMESGYRFISLMCSKYIHLHTCGKSM